jgi:hypothetical protein
VKKRKKRAMTAEPTEQQKNLELCKLELQAILEKYGLGLKGVPVFTPDGRVEVSIIFVKAAPKEEASQEGSPS